MTKLTIDGTEIEVPAGSTVIQACESAGVEIPRFCYHERLAIAGNCRMCLVEVSPGPPKPQASCALPVAENMVVKTNTPMVKKAREGVMEFLLINHPLDCPICDQGGECDLQDQALAYGTGLSRYHEEKRAVTDKYMGPLIKTQMTRCIHCTRCVRFAEDIAGTPVIGALGRGEHMEITTLEHAVASELSGNVVDLCPVGALTSRPYAYVARPWELRKTETIDVLDAVGSAIRVDSRGDAALRVLPRLNEAVNEEWISDKTRHAVDGLRYQRLDRPYLRKDGVLRPASWTEAFRAIAEKMKATDGKRIGAIVGDLVDMESMFLLRQLMAALASPNLDCRQDGAKLNARDRAGYRFNTTIEAIEQADAILIIGSNPRQEAPVLNARIRKAYLHGKLRNIFAIGRQVPLTYPTQWLGDAPTMLSDILQGNGEAFEVLSKAERPLILLGSGAVARADGAQILAAAQALAQKVGAISEGWNGFNLLQRAASRVGGLELGLVPGEGGMDVDGMLTASRTNGMDVLYLLGADEIDASRIGDETFVIYQGHHGDKGAQNADVVLPSAAYVEQHGSYMNTEGRLQQAVRAVEPRGEAREGWKVLRALSEASGKTLPYESYEEVRAGMLKALSQPLAYGNVANVAFTAPSEVPNLADYAAPFEYPIRDFYRTDPISRVSKVMAECSKLAAGNWVMTREQIIAEEAA